MRSDPVYTGNWPKGSLMGAMKEGERLLANPHLQNKTVNFLGNHGSFIISESIQEALFDTFNLERLAELQVPAMALRTLAIENLVIPCELPPLPATSL